MKKCHVRTSSIHGGGFVGIGLLWSSSYYIPHLNIFVLDVFYNLKCFNMGSNVSIPSYILKQQWCLSVWAVLEKFF